MTTTLLGTPGSPDDGEPGIGARGLATLKYCDDPHGEYVSIEHDDGSRDKVLTFAVVRYDPRVHDYQRRRSAVEEIQTILDRAGYRQIGPFTWTEGEAHVRVELERIR